MGTLSAVGLRTVRRVGLLRQSGVGVAFSVDVLPPFSLHKGPRDFPVALTYISGKAAIRRPSCQVGLHLWKIIPTPRPHRVCWELPKT